MKDLNPENYHGIIRHVAFQFLEGGNFDGVLDLGGGFGNTAVEIKQNFGATNVGVIDLVASEQSCNPNLDFAVAGDLNDPAVIEAAGERYGPFDVILAMDVLEHLVDPWACVVALERHLRPGGVLIASIPNVAHFSVSIKLFVLGQWRLYPNGILDRTHLRFFTRQTAKELLESGGLRVGGVSYTVSNHIYWKYVNWLRHFGFADRLAFQFIMAARAPS